MCGSDANSRIYYNYYAERDRSRARLRNDFAELMVLVTLAAPLTGFPPMNPASKLSAMMGAPILLGWVAHFKIGIIFPLG